MSLKSLDFQELKSIVDWVNLTEDVREFSLKFGDVELYVSRNQTSSLSHVSQTSAPSSKVEAAPQAAPAAPAPAAPASAAPTAPDVVAPAAAGALAADEVLIKAPMVGTFYASPKPGAPVFVSVGDRVEAQTVLCIVEVMKLMNNIEAGVDGTISRILVQNEQAVEYGQPLMVIKRSA